MISDLSINQKNDHAENQELSVAEALEQLNRMQQRTLPESDSSNANSTHEEIINDDSLQDRITQDIQEMVLGILKLDVQDFSPTTPLMNYGLDSISSTEIGNLFTSRFNIVIPPTVFFEFQDLNSFVKYLMDNHLTELQSLYGKTTASIVTANPASAESISQTLASTAYTKQPEVENSSSTTLSKPKVSSNTAVNDVENREDHYLLNAHAERNLDNIEDTKNSNDLLDIESLWRESTTLLLQQSSLKSNSMTTDVKQPTREYLQSMKRYTESANIHLVNRVGKRPLEYVSYGEGPPLLMLGGLLMHYNVMWLTNIEALSKKHELIMFHMPGCGELPLHEGMSLQSLTEDIAAVLDAHGLKKPLPVFGCSFGGVIAQAFAIAYPQRCSALAVAVSTPIAEGATDFQALMRELQMSSNFMELNRHWPMASLPAYEKVIEGFDFRDALKSLTIPSLIVSGGQDKYTTSAHGKMIATSLTNSKFVEFPEAGHLLTFSHYSDFNSLLIGFLEKLPKQMSSEYTIGNTDQALSIDNLPFQITSTKKIPIKQKTLEYATEYVRSGQQGHCIMLSDHSAQAAKTLRDLTVKNKAPNIDYRSYFVTNIEEALDAAIRIARHQSRNRNPQSRGWILILEQGTRWKNYFDPLNQGENNALVPAIAFANSLEDAQTQYSLEQFVAIVMIADKQTNIQELHNLSASLEALDSMSVLVDAEFTKPELHKKKWLSIEMQSAFDLIVHGEEIADYQAPVACVMIEKSLSNPWLMTPSEGYVRQPMASLGLTLHLSYQYCREQFYDELEPDIWEQTESLKDNQEAIYQTHYDYGNIGYAEVAKIHGFDQRFERGFGLQTQVLETVPQTNDVTKRNLIDCLSNVGAAPRGQNPQDLISDVFAHHNSEQDYWAELEKELSVLTGLDICFPASSQNSAIEQALTLGLLANSQRKKLLCFSGGAGFSMLSANAAKDPVFDLFRKPFEPLYPHVIFIDPNDSHAEADLVKHLISNDIACVWLETIQVEGNAVHTLPENLIRQVNHYKRVGGYLIGVDETQTNIGTGQFLHCDELVEEADIIALSTALTDCIFPCGAVLSSSSIVQRAYEKNPDRVQTMKQQQANPLAAHLAIHSLQKITEQNLLSHAQDMGRYLKSGLQSLANQYPLLKQVRGEGLVLAIEFDLTGYSAFIQQSFGYFLWGAMMRDPIQGILTVVCPIHNHSLRIMPPLTINTDEADQIIANINRRLDEGVEKILLNCAGYTRQRGNTRTAEFLENSLKPLANSINHNKVINT